MSTLSDLVGRLTTVLATRVANAYEAIAARLWAEVVNVEARVVIRRA